MEINTIRIITTCSILSVFCFITSCSKQAEKPASCPLTIDTVSTILAQKNKGKEYFLVERISGWQEKTIIIQLFDKKPLLDKCNADLIKPLFEDSLEPGAYLKKVTANTSENQFNLSYAEKGSDQPEITLEFLE